MAVRRVIEIAASWNETVDEDQLRRALARLVEVVPYEQAVLLVDDGEQRGLYASTAGDPFEPFDKTTLDPELHRHLLSGGSREAIIVSPGGTSFLRIPVHRDGGTLNGSLVMRSNRRYGKAELQAARFLAPFLTGTLERVRSYGKLVNDSKCKDAFLSVLGHDLRSPLSTLSSLVSVMRLGHYDADTFEMMENQIRYLTRMAEDVCDVGRIARGKISIDLVPLELDCVLRSGIERARPELDDREQHVSLHSSPTRLTVLGDSDRLSCVVAKLLSSWSKRTQRGATLAIAADRREDRAEIRVYSEGKPTRLARGTGGFFPELLVSGEVADLSFRIAADIVTLHGGTLDVANTTRGSEAIVTLPRTRIATAEHAVPTAADLVTALKERITPCRVLVVDDDRDVAISVGRVLEELGCTVVIAFDAEAALARAEEHAPELCLVNIGLPDIDGYQLARELRARGSRTKLVAMTGFASKAERERAFEAGFDAHVPKPVDLSSIAQVLQGL